MVENVAFMLDGYEEKLLNEWFDKVIVKDPDLHSTVVEKCYESFVTYARRYAEEDVIVSRDDLVGFFQSKEFKVIQVGDDRCILKTQLRVGM